MVITDMRMETDTAGYDVVKAARAQTYDPAVALLTADRLLGSDWQDRGANSMLVKPMNTNDLLRQIEALLVAHEDKKKNKTKKDVVAASAGSKRGTPAHKQAS